jgi:hypothetical protein
MSSELNYLSTCACVDAMDRIASKTYLRLSYEYGICILKRELIPTLAAVSLKSMISNISSLRENNDMSAYINLYDLVTFGLVELNFDETEKATNILPDFRIGPRGCKASGMNYEKYISKQVPIEKYDGRVLEVKSEDLSNVTWNDLLQQMIDAIYGNVNFIMDDKRIMTIFLEIFLEEMFYDLGMHKGDKDYAYKLFDILYFNYVDDDLWGTDVMPEYKLMVKNDAFLEDMVNNSIDEFEGKKSEESNYKPSLYWDK